jgi:hypothetical protein
MNPSAWQTCLKTFAACGLAALLSAALARGDEVDDHFKTIAQTGRQAAGSPAARAASDELAKRGGEIIPRLLAAMDTENPVAANWYRTIYATIVERELAAQKPTLDVQEVQAFVREPKYSGRARRLALELCETTSPGFTKSFVRPLLEDAEFRADAVDAALQAGQSALEGGDSEAAREEFQKAFEHARDSTQCVRAAGKLSALGEQADTQAHLGLVADWWLIGPFDAPGFSGFERVFPPERHVDLSAKESGQDGRELRWIRHRTNEPLGLVNLVEALGPAKEAVGYAYAELNSAREREGELRCGADDNCTVWLNGERVFGRAQWLNGTRFDRFTAPVRFQRGSNRVLVKICQGPPNRDPAVPNNWSLQLRFCDSTGAGLGLRSALPEAVEQKK